MPQLSFFFDLYVISILRRRYYNWLFVAINLVLFVALIALMALLSDARTAVRWSAAATLICLSGFVLLANLRFLFFVVISDSRLRGLAVRDRHDHEVQVGQLANRRSLVLLMLSYLGSLVQGMILTSALLLLVARAGFIICLPTYCIDADNAVLASLTLSNFLDQATFFRAERWLGVAALFFASIVKLVLITLIIPALFAYREASSPTKSNGH